MGIPEYLCKNDKPIINTFGQDELLYRRHYCIGTEVDIKDSKDTITQIFKIHDDSYNKSSLSHPLDVLLNDNPNYPKDVYLNYGVIKINVSKLLEVGLHQINNDLRKFTLAPKHIPTDCNYAHCEIHCLVDGFKAEKKPKSITTVFRLILGEMFEVVKEAS
ncbi:hypothetical protein [uncultured Mucilaginibacter sp.]|uniref:hypothetical protein n=1 Tax=uncultured Mucilaginibacter sp. TaxID=797541 RepID=UPI00261D3565|nr:hypothetical protein [uncultured Mucilaginibacter sp.]